MGKPRLSNGRASDWRAKVDTRFCAGASALTDAIVRYRRGDENASADFYARLEEIRTKFPTRSDGPPTPADIIYVAPPQDFPPSANEEAKGMLSWLHWNRFRIPLWQDAMMAKFDPEASKRITRTVTDYDDRRTNSFWEPRFKIDLDHSAIFELGLTLGLEALTEEELAECFDSLCPCGKSHSGDALRKQRDRLIADLQRSLVWEIEVAPKFIRGKSGN